MTNGRTWRNMRPSEVRTESRGVTTVSVLGCGGTGRRLERLDHVHQHRLVLRRCGVLHDPFEAKQVALDANQVAHCALGALRADARVLDERSLASLAVEHLGGEVLRVRQL